MSNTRRSQNIMIFAIFAFIGCIIMLNFVGVIGLRVFAAAVIIVSFVAQYFMGPSSRVSHE